MTTNTNTNTPNMNRYWAEIDAATLVARNLGDAYRAFTTHAVAVAAELIEKEIRRFHPDIPGHAIATIVLDTLTYWQNNCED